MKNLFRTLGLWLLLILAQHGAVVHELSHVAPAGQTGLRADSVLAAHGACAQCPAFAQVVTPAFSDAFQRFIVQPAAVERIAGPALAALDAALVEPRSRGPPS